MIIAIDVHYFKDNAVAAGVIFEDWSAKSASEIVKVEVANVAPYESGAFYKRELPCILKLLGNVTSFIDCVVVDGFVCLGPTKKDGLGMHLYRALDQTIPIIGVAKNSFSDTPESDEVYRGKSKKPLWVTAVGMDAERAQSCIKGMHGDNRIPFLLKLVDQACRGIEVKS